MALTDEDARTFERCIAGGGFAVFGADTVYGLACDPDAAQALQRIHLLKGRPMDKPSAVLFFSLELMWDVLPELAGAERAAAEALLPGPVTLLLPNPGHRFPLACGPDPGTLGIRVPAVAEHLAPLRTVSRPVLQTSANPSGGADARRLADVPQRFRDAADLVLDAGELPGTASTVIDLRSLAADGSWRIVREGALGAQQVADRLGGAA